VESEDYPLAKKGYPKKTEIHEDFREGRQPLGKRHQRIHEGIQFRRQEIDFNRVKYPTRKSATEKAAVRGFWQNPRHAIRVREILKEDNESVSRIPGKKFYDKVG